MNARWSTPMMLLHWLSAALVAGLVLAGLVFTELPAASSERLQLSRLHSLAGGALVLLTIARLLLRRRGPSPAPLPLPALHRRGVGLLHALLYAVIFSLGASGLLTAARSAWPDYLQGRLAEAPALDALLSRDVHEALAFTLVGLVLTHVAGVLLHQLRRGGALGRMLPLRATSRDEEHRA